MYIGYDYEWNCLDVEKHTYSMDEGMSRKDIMMAIFRDYPQITEQEFDRIYRTLLDMEEEHKKR